MEAKFDVETPFLYASLSFVRFRATLVPFCARKQFCLLCCARRPASLRRRSLKRKIGCQLVYFCLFRFAVAAVVVCNICVGCNVFYRRPNSSNLKVLRVSWGWTLKLASVGFCELFFTFSKRRLSGRVDKLHVLDENMYADCEFYV